MSIRKKTLIIIEELGEISTSAAIVNWNLSKLIAKRNTSSSTDILTLDNTNVDLIAEWKQYGKFFMHPKNNITQAQKNISKIYKLRGVIQTILGNDFQHFNRIKNIVKFLKINKNTYQQIVFLSGGAGFTPHQAIKYLRKYKTNTIGVYHDPYPGSSYPEPYKGGSRKLDFFKRNNLQLTFNKLDNIVFPSQRLYEWYLKDYKIDENKVKIIPHAINYSFQSNISKEKKTEGLLITHTGTLLAPRDPSVFLNIFNSINKNSVYFYGNVNQQLKKKLSKFQDSKPIHIIDNRISYDESLQKLSNSDFLLLIESNAKDNPFLPTKFVDYVHMNKPILVLSPENSEVNRLLGKQYPFTTTLNNNERINQMLCYDIYDAEKINKAMHILQRLKEYFSFKNITEQYIKMLE